MISRIGLVGILALATVGCDRGPTATVTKVPTPATPAATTTPASKLSSIPQVDVEGLRGLIAAASKRDEVLVIDFWATWCAPCVDLFPALHEGVEKLGPKVRLMSVTLDTPGELETAAIEFLGKQHATSDAYMLEPDTDKRLAVVDGLGKRWNNLVVPAILVYGRDGKLAYEFFEQDKLEDMLAKIEQLKTAGPNAGPPESNAATSPATEQK